MTTTQQNRENYVQISPLTTPSALLNKNSDSLLKGDTLKPAPRKRKVEVTTKQVLPPQPLMDVGKDLPEMDANAVHLLKVGNKTEERMMLEGEVKHLIITCPQGYQNITLPPIFNDISRMTDEELNTLFETLLYANSQVMDSQYARNILGLIAKMAPVSKKESLKDDMEQDIVLMDVTKSLISTNLGIIPDIAKWGFLIVSKIFAHWSNDPKRNSKAAEFPIQPADSAQEKKN